jgi:putative lipoic acid-binding regulatory protein
MADTPEESVIEFPCDFPIKAMGVASETLQDTVVDIVRRHAPDLPDSAVTARPSSNGKYYSITVTVRARSRAQLDAIYQDLTDCQHVLMVL